MASNKEFSKVSIYVDFLKVFIIFRVISISQKVEKLRGSMAVRLVSEAIPEWGESYCSALRRGDRRTGSCSAFAAANGAPPSTPVQTRERIPSSPVPSPDALAVTAQLLRHLHPTATLVSSEWLQLVNGRRLPVASGRHPLVPPHPRPQVNCARALAISTNHRL